jgi:8-oxo-dGTP pyrophosphatase MutT (NUDIX family)
LSFYQGRRCWYWATKVPPCSNAARTTECGELPAGGCEPGQSFRTAAIAELFEETGIVAKAEDLEPFASLSEPSIHTLTYPNGDQVQAFAMCFVLATWEGSLSAEESEVSDLGFFPLEAPPTPTHNPTLEVLKMYTRFRETGLFQAR